jgi:hypothetical protein
MKTALTEWFDELKANYPYMADEIYQKGFEKYLEKENKQIMDSWKEGTKYIMDINEGKNIPSMSAIDYLIYFKTEKKDYYTSF